VKKDHLVRGKIMKLDYRYSQKLYYRQIIEVSDEDYKAALALFKQNYDESEDRYDWTFDEYLENCMGEFLEELGIEASCDEKYIVDGDGIEDEYFLSAEDELESEGK
jgi:hypothetical protein